MGTAGGAGGGGAGGTIKLVGSVVVTDAGTTVDLTGGASSGNPGGAGRLLIGDNCGPSYGGSGVYQTPETGPGPMLQQNPFLAGTYPPTPYIPDLVGGAEGYGLSPLGASDFPAVCAAAPPGARAALVRMDVGPGMPDFAGYDALFYVNLSDEGIDQPGFGLWPAPDAYFLWYLIVRGCQRDPAFGGSGPVTLDVLDGQGVYVTLMPEDQPAGTYFMQCMIHGQIFQAYGTGALADGEALYLVPEPGALVLLAVGGLSMMCRRRK